MLIARRQKKNPKQSTGLGFVQVASTLGFWVGRRRGVGGWKDAARPAFAAKQIGVHHLNTMLAVS